MRFLFIILILGYSVLAQAQVQDGWGPYRSPEGQFTVMTKGIFKKATYHSTTEIGDMDMFGFSYPAKPTAKDVIYTVMYYDFPEGSIHSDSTELANEFFKETVNSAKESVNGVVAYDSDIELNGYKGKHWRVNYNDGKRSIYSRAYLVKNRCYILNVISPDVSKSSGDATYYFNSFRLF